MHATGFSIAVLRFAWAPLGGFLSRSTTCAHLMPIMLAMMFRAQFRILYPAHDRLRGVNRTNDIQWLLVFT